MIDDVLHDAAEIDAVKDALLNTIGTAFGVMFSDAEADQLLTAIEQQGYALTPIGEDLEALEPPNLPQMRPNPAVQVHVHVSASDTKWGIENTVRAAMQAVEPLPTD